MVALGRFDLVQLTVTVIKRKGVLVRRVLPWVVGGVAASVLLTEIALTRLFSVLLFYHYSFLAVALALFGLAGGGLSAAGLVSDRDALPATLRNALVRGAAALLVLVPVVVLSGAIGDSALVALVLACFGAFPFFFLGQALAVSLAAGREEIHGLYAIDLIASAAAALLTIPLLRIAQGPVVLEVPALIALSLALALTPKGQRISPSCAVAVVGAVVLLAVTRAGPLIQLLDPSPGRYLFERWNSHSRVRVVVQNDRRRWLVIDKTAASVIPPTPAAGQTIPEIDARWGSDYKDVTYVLGRSPRRVAIIGVGGGPDILPALTAGATRIDGMELNDRILELLQSTMGGYSTIVRRPEVHLIHDEARHALQHNSTPYDVIRANLIDTWAATAQGGFVLAENGIYTVEAWRLFLSRLTPAGVLVTTRWYLQRTPAEAQRLIALAAEALDAEGLAPAGRHLVAVAMPTGLEDPLAGTHVQTITVLASRRAYTEAEVAAIEAFVRGQGGHVLLAPGRESAPDARSWAALLTPVEREAAIGRSMWAIAPPTDQRPFFFLQLRPRDVFAVGSARFGLVSTITINGVRVLLLTVSLAILTALGIVWAAGRGMRRGDGRLSVIGRWYFACIGLGYMAVQLALIQRLSIVLGHPITCLALVVATMLLGTGLGSAAAGLPRLRRAGATVLLVPLAFVTLLVLTFGRIAALDAIPSLTWTAVGAGLLSSLAGLALGVALPTGMRAFAPTSVAVTEAWAINGAFSVLGSAAAALGGLILGSRGLLAAAIPAYGLALTILVISRRDLSQESVPAPAAIRAA
jgi:hypothetical protein